MCSLLSIVIPCRIYLSQHTTKPTKRFMRPAKTQISLRIRAVWSESLQIACAFYSVQAIQRRINENPCHTEWMYRLIWVFAGYTDLIVGFAVRWLIYLHYSWWRVAAVKRLFLLHYKVVYTFDLLWSLSPFQEFWEKYISLERPRVLKNAAKMGVGLAIYLWNST